MKPAQINRQSKKLRKSPNSRSLNSKSLNSKSLNRTKLLTKTWHRVILHFEEIQQRSYISTVSFSSDHHFMKSFQKFVHIIIIAIICI